MEYLIFNYLLRSFNMKYLGQSVQRNGNTLRQVIDTTALFSAALEVPLSKGGKKSMHYHLNIDLIKTYKLRI